MKYKSYIITCDPPPIPMRDFDYRAVHEDYDGGEDSDDVRCFTGASIQSVKALVDELIGDN